MQEWGGLHGGHRIDNSTNHFQVQAALEAVHRQRVAQDTNTAQHHSQPCSPQAAGRDASVEAASVPEVPLATGCVSAGATATDTHAVPSMHKASESNRTAVVPQDCDRTSSGSTAAQQDTPSAHKRRIQMALDASTARKSARLQASIAPQPARCTGTPMLYADTRSEHAMDPITAGRMQPDSRHSQSMAEEGSAAVRQRFQRIQPLFVHFFDSYNDERSNVSIVTPRLSGGTYPWFPGLCTHREQPQLALPAHLAALAGDLHAVSRYQHLELCSVMQHNACTTQGLQNRKMVCSVALDRSEENLATVGAFSLFSIQDPSPFLLWNLALHKHVYRYPSEWVPGGACLESFEAIRPSIDLWSQHHNNVYL
jgi:hypothetical protein